jgi:hypothetical protein
MLFLERNKIKNLAGLVEMVKADTEGPKRMAPFLRLYLAGNPLSALDDAVVAQIGTLKAAGVRFERSE